MRRALLLAGRVGLGGVFLYAAYTKLRQPWTLLAVSIDSYRMLPEWAVLALARTLPWLELGIGILLVAGYRLRPVTVAASALLALFFGVMSRAFFQGLGIDCGCFGVGEALSARTLVRDGLLVLVSIFLMVAAFRQGTEGRATTKLDT
jgi:uncharacterized membrane protein YphA (DoxX/SURF4 family)